MENEYIVIRKKENLPWINSKPIWNYFFQTNIKDRPVNTDILKQGQIAWLKWSGGDIIMKAEVDTWEEGQLLEEELSKFRIEQRKKGIKFTDKYWKIIEAKGSFKYTLIKLRNQKYLKKPIKVSNRSQGQPWIIIDSIDKKRKWLYSEYTKLRDSAASNFIKNSHKNSNFDYTLKDQDAINILQDISTNVKNSIKIEKVISCYKRNIKYVNKLKKMYEGFCQICGSTFEKKNKQNYSECHHIIPLGENGSDVPSNMIIVCPNCHKMLHYANITLKKLKGNIRIIEINKQTKEICYVKEHFELFDSEI